MASGFFALLDDIAAIMDDVAATSKVATQKTSGILGDDLAVAAEKASGFKSSDEIPVLWAICKGSFLNKLIILPIAFLLSAILPSAIIPILLIGGIYLAFEGAEKIHHYIFHKKENKTQKEQSKISPEEAKRNQKKKIKSAIVVDFILSVEIVIIALSSVIEEPLSIQIMSVSITALIATIGVYGIVALIVRMDDLGYKLITMSEDKNSLTEKFGRFLVNALPKLIKSLSFIGTIAMLLVAGGIFVHNIHYLHELLQNIPSILGEFIVGLLVGTLVLTSVKTYSTVMKKN